jgi:putative ABC transport system permease protein
MVLGITLGVALMVAIDLANASASRAFDLSADSIAGRATHQIIGGPRGLDESLFASLRRQPLLQAIAPIVTEYVVSPQLGSRPFTLLGVDPFSEAPFRNYLGGEEGVPIAQLTAFLTRPGAILISAQVAGRYGLQACPDPLADAPAAQDPACTLTLEVNGQPREVFLAGLLEPVDALSQRALDSLILADIATAQELTGRIGQLDRIDLILPEAETGLTAAGSRADLIRQLEAQLPPGARLQEVSARSGAVKDMTDAFRVNLTALSLLALLVGLFLIYNTITFSVIQRRPLFGTLRCLGVTRQEVFALVVGEAFAVGALGSGLGLLLGVLLGQAAVQLVTQTINDLFFVVTVRGVQVPTESLLKGGLIGLAATVLTAAPPAWEAASVPPRIALFRSGLESKAQRAIAGLSAAGLLLAAAGGGILLLFPQGGLVISFAGTFAVIVGFAMLTPTVTIRLMQVATPIAGRLWGLLGRMAPRDLVKSLSRTSVAVAALMVAVSVTIGVSLMTGSFRFTVQTWLSQTLQGDLYISIPGLTAAVPGGVLEPEVRQAVLAYPAVADVAQLRAVTVDSPRGQVNLSAVDHPLSEPRLFLASEGSPEAVWQAMQAGAILVSEPFANRFRLPMRGGQVSLYTDRGLQTFPVAGVFYDYAATQGTLRMELETYRRYWDDPEITALAVFLQPGADVDLATRELQDRLAPVQRLFIRPNQALRAEALAIFDRTFAITGAMQVLSTVVAFIGVLSTLFSLQLEKQRELGILRAVGLTGRQLWRLVLLQTGLMGTVAGLLAMPTGYILSLILIYIINRRSFGWTLQMQLDPLPFLVALGVAVSAALLAGLYPAYRMSKMMTAEALRGD